MRNSLTDKKLEFHFDSLESRKMLAGNISVQVNNAGDIRIIGDSEANEFTLDADDGGGGTDLVITGTNGTTVTFNGTTAASQVITLDTASTVGRNLRIFTRSGDDVVTVNDTDVAGTLLIRSGSGDDTVNLGTGTYANAGISTQSGQDAISLNTVTIDSNLGVSTGSDDDTLDLQTVTVGNTALLVGSRGSDDIMIDGSQFNQIVFSAGSGSDTGQLSNSNATGRAIASMGSGADSLDFAADVVFSDTSIFSGGGGDDSFDGFTANFTHTKRFGSVETQTMVADDIADQAATENSAFSFTVPTAGFADVSDTPTLTATLADDSALPAWLSFDGTDFTGTPADADVGTISVKVSSTNGTLTISDTFDIVVGDVNNTPTVAMPIADQAATEGSPFSFTVPNGTFADLDASDTLTLTAAQGDDSALPAWLSFDGTAFTGTPADADVGTLTVKVTASDGTASVSDNFDIVISDINNAPTVDNPIVDQAATEGSAFAFTVPANTFGDLDASDTLTLTATLDDDSALPAWLSFDGTAFTGTPADADVGTITVKVTASDGSLSVSDSFDIVISDINNTPTVDNPIADQVATQSVAFNFAVPANTFGDLDASDTLTLTATLSDNSALPAWLSFDGTTFTGTPAGGDVGTITVKVTASDGSLSVFDEFDIVIS